MVIRRRISRREMLRATVAAMAWLAAEACQRRGVSTITQKLAKGGQSMLDVDQNAPVSRADLTYRSPAKAPLEGQAIGNGRMGTMVWTTPKGFIGLQINRADVFAVSKGHIGDQAWPIGPQTGPVDYCGGCAALELDLGGDVFVAGDSYEQRLSLYDAEVRLEANAVQARCFISAMTDVLVIEVDDQRPEPQPLRLTIWMWRNPEVKTGEHLARYAFRDLAEAVVLEQRFDEGDHHCASAVAAQVVGAEAHVEARGERVRAIITAPKQGKTTLLISSAASWSPQEDVGAAALKLVKDSSARSYDALREQHVRWWHDFWARTFVHISSSDGLGDFMERVRTLHLYYMAASSRGVLPPKWNGSLFITDGDVRAWGSQYWVWTTEMHYYPLLAADASDLTEPYFDMYLKQLPDARKAAEQRWGVKGAFYPETTPFDGPVVLPEDAAFEFRDVYFGRKPVTELSEQTRALCSFDSSLRTVAKPEGKGPVRQYSWISHLVSSGCELAVQAWWRYRCTGDKEWLRRAYPLLRDVVEFYRHLVEKGEDGRYHVAGTNVHEDFWGAKDGIMDLAAIRGTTPLAMRAAEILRLDADLRASWQELLDNLAPYPMGSDPEAKALTGGILADDTWAAGYLGEVDGSHNLEDVWLNPIFPFEDWTLETRDPKMDRIAQKAVDLAPRMKMILGGAECNTAIRTPIAAVRAGRGEQLPAMLASYYRAFQPMVNGWGLFEGADQAHSIEILGCISMVLQEGLLQSVSPRPGQPEVIRVFPAWPKEWEAEFRLLARGGFLVTSAIRNGEVELVELESRLGEACRLRNPWAKPCLVSQIGGTTRELDGDILRFGTKKGKLYRILPKGAPEPTPRRISPSPATGPVSYSFTLPNGTVASGVLGRGK